jgi:hypothetical protein
MLDSRYIKTPSGHAEIQAKAMALSRPVRNLLLLINDSQPAAHWLSQIRGTVREDLAHLLAEGLIRDAAPAATVPTATAPAAVTPVAPPGPNVVDAAVASPDALLEPVRMAVRSATYTALYDALTSQGKSQLGLVKGFRFVLEVEKCNGLAELHALALRFLDQLRDDHGMSAVRRFGDALSSQVPNR